MARTEDSHVAKQAAQAAPLGDGPAPEAADATLPEAYPAVVVRDETPALMTVNMATLGTNNPVRPVLPQDPHRRGAVLIAIDNDVYLASSLEVAQAAYGGSATTTSTLAGYLPKSLVLPLTGKGALWAAATTTSSQSRITVITERDDN